MFCITFRHVDLYYNMLCHRIVSSPVLSHCHLSCPVLPYCILSRPVPLYPVLSCLLYPVPSCPTVYCPVLSCCILSRPAPLYPVLSHCILSCRTIFFHALSWPISSWSETYRYAAFWILFFCISPSLVSSSATPKFILFQNMNNNIFIIGKDFSSLTTMSYLIICSCTFWHLCLSVCLSATLHVCVSVCCCLPVCLSVCLSAYLPVCMCVCVCVLLSACVSIYLRFLLPLPLDPSLPFIHLPLVAFIYLSIYYPKTYSNRWRTFSLGIWDSRRGKQRLLRCWCDQTRYGCWHI